MKISTKNIDAYSFILGGLFGVAIASVFIILTLYFIWLK